MQQLHVISGEVLTMLQGAGVCERTAAGRDHLEQACTA